MKELYFIPKHLFAASRSLIDGFELVAIELSTHYAVFAKVLSYKFRVYIDDASANNTEGLQRYIDELMTTIGAEDRLLLKASQRKLVTAAINPLFKDVNFLCVQGLNVEHFNKVLDRYVFGRPAVFYHSVVLGFDDGRPTVEFSVPYVDIGHWEYLAECTNYRNVHAKADMGSGAHYNAMLRLLSIGSWAIPPIRRADFYAVKKVDINLVMAGFLANGVIVSTIYDKVLR